MKFKTLCATLSLCAFAVAPAAAQDPVKIGFITTLSGPAGYLGNQILDGFRLAVEDGKLGGVPVELVAEDDGFKPANGRQIADRMLYDEDIKLFTGIVFSNIAGATVPDILDADAIYVSPNAAPSVFAGEGCNENYFVVAWQNDSLHEAAGENAKNLGFEKAFVLAPNYQAGKDAITGFKRMFDGEIVGELYTQLGQTDFAAEMAQIRDADPDVVFQFQPGGMGIAFMRQYQQAGLLGEVPMVVSEPSMDGVILEALGDAAIGIKGSAHWAPDFDNEANKTFMSKWEETYDQPVTFYASQGYDTALLIASALEATGGDVSDIDAFREALRKADFSSVRGDFEFGPNQHPIQDWYSIDVVAGEDGMPMLKTNEVILEDHGDAYSDQCQM